MFIAQSMTFFRHTSNNQKSIFIFRFVFKVETIFILFLKKLCIYIYLIDKNKGLPSFILNFVYTFIYNICTGKQFLLTQQKLFSGGIIIKKV